MKRNLPIEGVDCLVIVRAVYLVHVRKYSKETVMLCELYRSLERGIRSGRGSNVWRTRYTAVELCFITPRVLLYAI
jgi:hypothetical protein